MDTTIVISYRPGTADLLKVCLASLARYTSHDVKILIVSTDISEKELMDCKLNSPFKGFELRQVKVQMVPWTRIHGHMLDAVIPKYIDTEYFLTLDSDCFPVADGWLNILKGILKTCKIAGIAQPWAPPPESISKTSVEYRVRSQQCWNRTHVACQMIRTEDYLQLNAEGATFVGGDDTGLLVNKMAAEKGWRFRVFMPSRCPLGKRLNKGVFPELNRSCCVVYGDFICHIGAYTRGQMGQDRPDSVNFEWAVKRIMADGGAEFLLEDRLSHKYLFDREEVVAAYKVNQIFGVSADGRNIKKT